MTDSSSETPDQEPTAFSAATTRAVMEAACHAVGFNPDGAILMRLGENALYRLAAQPIVVRIGRTLDYWNQVQNEVSVANWLADVGYPAAKTVELDEQPVAISGHPVTYWQFISGRSARPEDVSTLASLLRKFHELDKPQQFELPDFNFGERVEKRLKAALAPNNDKSYLLGKFRELLTEADSLQFRLEKAPVHGDAHIKNVMVSDGKAILIDFEAVGWGHPEWDLAVTATEYTTGKLWTNDQYQRFVEWYGFDITAWSGFDVLRQIQEIKMTTWLMQNINESKEIADEFRVRMDAIRTGASGQPWKPY